MDLVQKVVRTVRMERLLQPGDSIVAAVSGGPDSVALLHILFSLSQEWGWRLLVAHVNHGFRPEESLSEAQFVRELCQGMGLVCEVLELDMPAILRSEGGNPQDAARAYRYAFLEEVAIRHGANRIALAHHANDQAETVLMRLMHGAGLAGLAGIPISRKMGKVELVRPLLRIYRSEVMNYVQDHDLSYVVDSSNEQLKYERNRIRLEALPYLQQFNARLPEALNRLAQITAAEDDYAEGEARETFNRLVQQIPGEAAFARKHFIGLHFALQRRLIKLILNYLSRDTVSFDFLGTELAREAIVQETPTTLELHIGSGIRLVREYESIRFTIQELQAQSFDILLQPDADAGTLEVPQAGASFLYTFGNSLEELSPHRTGAQQFAVFDAEALHFPLRIRNRHDGDRMQIAGLNGSKKVKDIFIDEKIAPERRSRIPIVTDREGAILWIPGLRRSVHAQATDKTSRLFCIRLLRHEE